MSKIHPEYPALVLPAHISRQAVRIWNNGMALDGDLYKPASLMGSNARAPAVVMSHGLGGSKRTAERYAAEFADLGLVALTFTHAGWSESDSHLYRASGAVGESQASVRMASQVVDPLEWVQSMRVALDFLEGEDNVDIERMGAWGTSYGGGIALFAACNDDRIKALAIQVGSVAGVRPPLAQHARQRAIDMARGILPSVPDASMDQFPTAPGIPHYPRMRSYRPLNEIYKLKAPILMVDAGAEEMFDIRDNCGRIRDFLAKKGGVTFHYEVIPGIDHYGIYFDGYQTSMSLARAWFARHLFHTARP
ncbi:MAG TPA: dienelactone hydrolase family protein [Ramlibacter sp.]|nr:dienelactone hydrolase family protein [Ramlibacter sp.]